MEGMAASGTQNQCFLLGIELWQVPGFHFGSLRSRIVRKESGCEDAVYDSV
jgi:hypothetical protein